MFRRLATMRGCALATGGLAALAPAPAWALVSLDRAKAFAPWGSLAAVLLLALVFAMLWWRGRNRLGVFQAAVEALDDAAQIVAANGRPVHANAAFRTAFPGAEDSMASVLFKRAAGEGQRDALIDLEERAASGEAGEIEVEIDSQAVQPVWFCVRARPMEGRSGLVLWSASDITLRRQLQMASDAEHERFVDLLEHAPIGFYSVDEAGRFLFANPTMASWLGTSPERLADGNRTLHEVTAIGTEAGAPPHLPFAPEAPSAEPVAPGETVHGEVTFVGPGGRGFQAYVTQEAVPGETEGSVTTRTVVRNLTRERAVADALERSERRFRRFFEEAPVGIALLDGRGRVSECNPAFGQLLGESRQMLAGRSFVDLVRAADRPAVTTALNSADAGERDPPPEVRSRQGETVFTMFATALDDGDGHAGHVVHLIDTTEQKNLEEQFTRSQKMQAVGQLAGGIAHDFNNLLTAMIGFCDLLLLRHRPGDQSFADLMQVKQNANRAANLVRQLLAFSRQQTLRPTVLSVTDVLTELMHLLRRLIGENIELQIGHGRDLFPVKVDQGQLEQVIINLAVNARDAMAEKGGKLAITTENVELKSAVKRKGESVPPGDYALIRVSDTGCGISVENLDRIFEPFFSTKEPGAGTGLGLSTVYGIVKQTGGFILVDSLVDSGTTFRIYLPRHHQASEAVAHRDPEPQPVRDLTGVGTLLLVEDEEAVRAFSARALRKKGYEVLEASSGEQALEILESSNKPLDLLITDVVMPHLDGPALVSRIREKRPTFKVIFISGYAESAFREHLDADANIHFLPKPFSLKQLAGIVKEVLQETETAPTPEETLAPVAIELADNRQSDS